MNRVLVSILLFIVIFLTIFNCAIEKNSISNLYNIVVKEMDGTDIGEIKADITKTGQNSPAILIPGDIDKFKIFVVKAPTTAANVYDHSMNEIEDSDKDGWYEIPVLQKPDPSTFPLIYIDITASDGSVSSYSFKVQSSLHFATYYILKTGDTTTDLTHDVAGKIETVVTGPTSEQKQVRVTLPCSVANTKYSSLIAKFSGRFKTAKIGTTLQVSGVTPNNFSAFDKVNGQYSQLTYTLTGSDGNTALVFVQVGRNNTTQFSYTEITRHVAVETNGAWALIAYGDVKDYENSKPGDASMPKVYFAPEAPLTTFIQTIYGKEYETNAGNKPTWLMQRIGEMDGKNVFAIFIPTQGAPSGTLPFKFYKGRGKGADDLIGSGVPPYKDSSNNCAINFANVDYVP
jgi:hypothetical protein